MSDESNPFDSPREERAERFSTQRRGWQLMWLLGMVVLTGGCWPPLAHRASDFWPARTQDNLSTIGRALMMYESRYAELPPAVVTDAAGKPLYSWRVLLLEEFGRPDLKNRFDFNQAWDSPANRQLIKWMPEVLRSPYPDVDSEAGMTSYQALVDPVGNRTAMKRTSGRKLKEVTDGLSNTVLILENRAKPVIWTKPDDTDPATFLAQYPLGEEDNEVTVGLCSGSTRRYRGDFHANFREAMYANDDEVPPR